MTDTGDSTPGPDFARYNLLVNPYWVVRATKQKASGKWRISAELSTGRIVTVATFDDEQDATNALAGLAHKLDARPLGPSTYV